MANDAVLLKRLTYDLTRITKSNLGTFDNDAKSCYDRIVNGLAMLAARNVGMPLPAVQTHAGVLAAMRYTIKTSFGTLNPKYAILHFVWDRPREWCITFCLVDHKLNITAVT
jgi:hypothetical protein